MKSIIHPYRRPHPTGRRVPAALGEEVIFYVALCAVGAIPIASMASRGDAFGVEPTIGLLMMAAGLAGLCAALLAMCRVPRDRDAR
jgi:hypothetical protein